MNGEQGPQARIARLRAHATGRRRPSSRSEEWELLWYRGWMDAAESSSLMLRRGRAKAYLLASCTPVIDNDELIVGKPSKRELTGEEARELEHHRSCTAKAMPRTGGQASHMAIDYEKLLRRGVLGIRAEIRERTHSIEPGQTDAVERQEFYAACEASLEGLLRYASSYAEHAREIAANEVSSERRAELESIARTLDHVPAYPATTFREAVQSVHFVTFCLSGLYQLGRPDRYLIDYYRRDIAEGRLTKSEAQELIDCLCVLFNEYVPGGLAVGFMIGGRDAHGTDVCNELTAAFLESIDHTRMIYPGIGLCVTPDTPENVLHRACRLLAEGRSHPALFNDETITRGLKQYGLPDEDACSYVHSTCVEITPVASSAVWVASPYINLTAPLLQMLGIQDVPEEDHDAAASGTEDPEWGSFAEFKSDYRSRLSTVVAREATAQNRLQAERYHAGGDPLVSCFVRDCLARGLDVDRGGARYNWIMPSFVGMANLVDSLEAIDHLVFRRGELTFDELAEILTQDYEGHEAVRLEILNDVPKYGNDVDEVDALASEITEWIREETARHTTFRGDRFVPSLFCWIMHERLGGATCATPDGRRSGFPLGDGSGPAQGREHHGPTASILSSTKWDHAPFIGGIAVNLKFSRSMVMRHGGDDAVDRILDLVKTFMDRGGFELQINVLDAETLVSAKEDPDSYRDLVVRIGGYSDYFVQLSPAMQDELIMRTEHQI